VPQDKSPDSPPEGPASVLFKLDRPIFADLVGRRHPIRYEPDPAAALTDDERAAVRVILTTGLVGLTAEEMAAFPALGLVCTLGTGYEGVDTAEAVRRGILVTHAAGANVASVAEHAFGLLLAINRHIPAYDRALRRGVWRDGVHERPGLGGRRLGIFGMGGVGRSVAPLARAFGMEVHYASRSRRPDLPFPYHGSLTDLAQAVDDLVICAPGGPETFHAVDAAVLAALGPGGFVVNVGRGSLIDTEALVAALRDGTIAGAALDVFETEPEVPEALRSLGNVVMTPHVAGMAVPALDAAAERLIGNIDAFFAGTPLVSPVPETRAMLARRGRGDGLDNGANGKEPALREEDR